jgi:hypothetical protein
MLQTAIGVELGTLPPYLYALYSIRPGTNPQAEQLIRSVALQEMIHMCLDCNILNALGTTPAINPQKYPGPLPGDIGPGGEPLQIHLYPFSPEAMQQGMAIEQPEHPPDIPVVRFAESVAATQAVTIGQFYALLDTFLSKLPDSAWTAGRNQIVDDQFFPSQLFAVNNHADAQRAISIIVTEGEGTEKGTSFNPLDFQDEAAHYFRFGEIYNDRVLTKADNPAGYTFGPQKLGVNWAGSYPAIPDPGKHDFSKESPAAQAAQNACNQAFTSMINAIRAAVSGAGAAGSLGQAVRAMFDLRMAAMHAMTVPLADPAKVAGPAFLYIPNQHEGGAR